LTGWLEDKVIVCTGAGSGIGLSAVNAFLDAGAAVGVLERDPAKVEAMGAHDRLFALEGDATSEAANARLLEEAGWDRPTLVAMATGRLPFRPSDAALMERHGLRRLALG